MKTTRHHPRNVHNRPNLRRARLCLALLFGVAPTRPSWLAVMASTRPGADAFAVAVFAKAPVAGEVIAPARVALTGRKAAPGIFEVIWLVGREAAVRRLRAAAARWQAESPLAAGA